MARKTLLITLVILSSVSLAVINPSFATDRFMDPLDYLSGNSWEQISFPIIDIAETNPGPSCSGFPGTDSRFSFFVKPGLLPFVMVFLDGGGACWNDFNCLYSPTFQPYIGESVESMNTASGIFDSINPENPFQAWTQIYIPYYTGDLHFGQGDSVYFGPDGQSVTLRHRGFVNFMAVLDWMHDNIQDPYRIFISGSSGGSYGILAAMPYIQRQYPDTKITFLSDAGAGVVAENFAVTQFGRWTVNPQLLSFVSGLEGKPFYEYGGAELMTILAAEYPEIKFGQYTSMLDYRQLMFYQMTKTPGQPNEWAKWPEFKCDWREQMLGNLTEAAYQPNYRYFIGPGTDHMILPFDKFYTEEVQGIRFVNWVRAMVWRPHRLYDYRGWIWRNLECTDCGDAPIDICP